MKLSKSPQYTLTELTQGLEVTIKGDPHCLVTGVSPIHEAKAGHLSFLTNSLYRKYLRTTEAAAVVLSEADAAECGVNAIISRNPYFTYAKIAAYFDHQPIHVSGIHPTAVIGEHCHIDPTASIAAHVVMGAHVNIAANVVIGAGCYIGDGVSIAEGSQLDANVTIYYHVKIGKRAHIASGVVIGSDGFGFANQKGVWHKVPQMGSVQIGDDVDIGTNTCIDRGAIEDTIIENGVKLDNLIQIGHNVRIGENTIVAGCSGFAGSTIIGKNCMFGGRSSTVGHITICDNVVVTGATVVTKSIHQPGMYSSGVMGVVTNDEFRKNNARFHRLENLIDRVKTLESSLKELTERKEK